MNSPDLRMSDRTVAEALRSNARLVVVQAPAGCGKTHQAADYARWLTVADAHSRVLILTHTHAACDVFRARTDSTRRQVHVTTIDGLVAQIAGMYHRALQLPINVTAWARDRGTTGFEQLAEMVSGLLLRSPAVSSALVARYPIVLCDEHQDANASQHAVIMGLFDAGAMLRVFGDPMQAIYVRGQARRVHDRRWAELVARAEMFEELDYPHRWSETEPALGRWILQARRTLKDGQSIDLTGEQPNGLTIISAHNTALRRGGFSLTDSDRRNVNRVVGRAGPLMILAGQNDSVRGINAYFGRHIPIWEGHTRDALHELVRSCQDSRGDAQRIAATFKNFIQAVGKGFSDSGFANRLLVEVATGAATRCTGKPAQLQSLARLLLKSPDHHGIARALTLLEGLIEEHDAFRDVKIDMAREFREAVWLGAYDDAGEGLAEITRRRSAAQPHMPSRFISTVHKAKGLERQNVILMPCDLQHFSDTQDKRCLLYVALSRARQSLTIVVSPESPSPLLLGP